MRLSSSKLGQMTFGPTEHGVKGNVNDCLIVTV